MLSFVKELGIYDGDKVSIDGNQCTADVKSSCVWFRSDHKNYCIDNIAKLLMTNPTFENKTTQKQISTIQYNDLLLKVNKKDQIYSLFSERNENKEDVYRLHNGAIRYSYGSNLRNDDKIIEPSANLITGDVEGFMPVDKNISMDSRSIYRHYYRVCDRLDDSFPQMIDNTDQYRKYGNKLFHRNNQVLDRYGGEIHMDNIKTICATNNKGYLKVVYNNGEIIVLSGRGETIIIKQHDKFKHKTGNFYSDGENIYLLYDGVYNITVLYNLPPYQNISPYSIDNDRNLIYKIGSDIFIKYDGEIGLEVVNEDGSKIK